MSRVLVIDDDSNMLRMIARSLSAEHEIVRAETAEAGIDSIIEQPVDLAIVDIVLPGKSGIWAIELIVAAHPNTKILAISGGGRTLEAGEALQAASAAGADATLMKPFRINELRAAVDRVLHS